MKRYIRTLFYFISYHCYLKYKLRKTHSTGAFGFTLEIPPSVFHPNYYFSSHFFGKYLLTMDLSGKSVLDMGCGSGVLSLIAASKGALATSIDINERAVEATRHNAEKNRFTPIIKVYHGDLFDALPGNPRFDLILFNPPFYEGEQRNPSEMAWKSGKEYAVVKNFLDNAGTYLFPNGKILIILSSDMDISKILKMFASVSLKPSIVASRKTIFDTLFVYELSITS